ncbi:hypothetical protein DPMN_158791 [Dreissena polymorpha]|uniref:Uncharacterized protein n=1 Tax=Dreissena polymorpha TaxID=45954 RepID=A0A9D4IMA8_DREPO|nr:hypothetical protein DPMN_158791 [Dreissena polymorpha]
MENKLKFGAKKRVPSEENIKFQQELDTRIFFLVKRFRIEDRILDSITWGYSLDSAASACYDADVYEDYQDADNVKDDAFYTFLEFRGF